MNLFCDFLIELIYCSTHLPCPSPSPLFTSVSVTMMFEKPIRGQYPGHVITSDQTEASIQMSVSCIVRNGSDQCLVNSQSQANYDSLFSVRCWRQLRISPQSESATESENSRDWSIQIRSSDLTRQNTNCFRIGNSVLGISVNAAQSWLSRNSA